MSEEIREYSGLVARVYDSGFEAKNWPAALADIAKYTGSDGVAIDFMDLERSEPVGAFSYGFDAPFRQSLIAKFARIWMIQSGFHHWPVGVPFHLPHILPEKEFLAGAFYREWCKPQENRDYVGLIAFRDSSRFVKMTFARKEGRGSYENGDIDRIGLLAPHLCKAVAISDAFRLESIRAGIFETLLDSLSTGVLLLDAGGRVAYVNQAAHRQLDTSTLLRIEGAALRVFDRDTNKRFGVAIKTATNAAQHHLPDAEFVTIGDVDSGGFIATVVPLARLPGAGLQAPVYPVGIFLRQPGKRPPFAIEAFGEFYRLTPAETRVAAVLSQGGGLTPVCDILGISLATARTHLKRIFAKTGTDRQAKLMALMSSTTAG